MASHEKSKNEIFTFGYLSETFNGVSVSTTYTGQSQLYQTIYDRRSDFRTPGYKSKKRTGARLPNLALTETYMSQKPIVAVGNGGGRSGNTWTLRKGNRITHMGGASAPTNFPSLNAELTLKALNRAKEQSFNLPIFLAEAGKTTDMVLNRLADLRGLARDLRRGDVREFLKKSRSFHQRAQRQRRVPGLPDRNPPPRGQGNDYPSPEAERAVELRFNRQFGRDAAIACGNTWLEWKYGWQSLMTDVVGLSKTIEDVRSKDANLDGVIKTSVTRRSSLTGPYSIEQSPSSSGIRRETLMEKGTLTCRFKINNPDLLLPAKVGLTNPLSVAWELIPFSFVVDWFLPIGKYLDALDVPLLYTFTDKILVNKYIWYRSVEVKSSDIFNYNVSGTGEKLVKGKSRDATSMALGFNSIQFKNGFANPERIFTSLALLGQTLVGFSHPSTR